MKGYLNKKGMILLIFLLLLIYATLPFFNAEFTSGKKIFDLNIKNRLKNNIPKTYDLGSVIIVDDEGDGDYTRIEDAVRTAKPGDTIKVYSGTYYETIELTKEINLIGIDYELGSGDDSGNPIVNGNNLAHVFLISKNQNPVKVVNFTIINSYSTDSGIVIRSSDNQIINCTIMNNPGNGIEVSNSYNTTISNCTIYANGEHGIYMVNGHEFTISNCTIYDNNNRGIRIDGHTTNCTIFDCEIYLNNREGIFVSSSSIDKCNIKKCRIYNNKEEGILMAYCLNITISDCNIYLNEGQGISLEYGSRDNIIENNTIRQNVQGGVVIRYSSSNNILVKNIIIDNGNYGIKIEDDTLIPSSNNNLFYCNSINNTGGDAQNAWDKGSNSWDNGTVGNYWKGFYAPDENGDGKRDEPYYIPPNKFGLAKDRFPLVDPIGVDWKIPEVSIIYPNGGEHLSGIINIIWHAFDNFSGKNLTIDIDYSPNNGKEWLDLVTDIENTNRYKWDTRTVPNGYQYIIRLYATDKSNNTARDISSKRFIINNDCPYVSKIIITDITIDNTHYVQNEHDVVITANVIDGSLKDGDTDRIWADLSAFGFTNPKNPDSYNDTVAIWKLTNVICNPPNGFLNVTVKAEDSNFNIGEDMGNIYADNTPPNIRITKPDRGLYLLDRKILPLPITIILGKITVIVSAEDEHSQVGIVHFYINWCLKFICEPPFEWRCDETISGKYNLQVVGYDMAENYRIHEISNIVIINP